MEDRGWMLIIINHRPRKTAIGKGVNGIANSSIKRLSTRGWRQPFFCDRGGIQTPNPQSRNLMRYSVAPRSQSLKKGNILFPLWAHLGSNQAPPDYESGALTY